MADAKLTALTAASALAAADLFYVSQSAASRKATGTQLLALVGTTYVPLAGGTMTGALTLPAGAVGTPQLMFTGAGATTGLYSSGSNNVSIAINGVRNCYFEPNATYIAGSTGLVLQSSSALLYFGVDGLLSLSRDAAAQLALRNGAVAQRMHIYGTADGSPGANYQRMVLSANGTTGVTIAAEGLGTPGANQNITLAPGGTGGLYFPGGASVDSSGVVTGAAFVTASAGYFGGVVIGYPSSDAAFLRGAAGQVDVTNGTAGTWRDLKLRNLLNTEYHQMTEMTAPAAPATNSVRIYAEDNGSGKTRLMALFATGAAQQIAIEP